MGGVFITGTDTEVGKTRVALAALTAARARGLSTAAMKPVASGAERRAEGLINADAARLRAAASLPLDYEAVNPYVFEPPIAPHIAARRAGVSIDCSLIVRRAEQLRAQAQFLVVEGIGGWRVPLSANADVADLAGALALPVILVVGLRLGCLNHALLTAESLAARGLPFAGWVANSVDPAFAAREDNVQALRGRLGAPLLGVLPYAPDVPMQAIADQLDWTPVFAASRPPPSLAKFHN